MFYSWETQEAFDAWHETVKSALGMPYPNKNSKTGLVDENATWTSNYTMLEVDDKGIKFAKVEDDIAARFSEGMGNSYEPFFKTYSENN